MGHKNNDKVRCYICKQTISEQDMLDDKVEMIEGPGESKKVFVHLSHEGVSEEVKKLYKKE